MDSLSQDLSAFLLRLHQHPDSVSERVEHFIKHLLYLLPDDDVKIISAFFGVNEAPLTSIAVLAEKHHCTVSELQARMEKDLRHLAVAPEWQMIKQLI